MATMTKLLVIFGILVRSTLMLSVLFLMLMIIVGCGDDDTNRHTNSSQGLVRPTAYEPPSNFSACTPPLPIHPHENIDHLILTELVEKEYENRLVWLEVFNPTPEVMLLSDYALRLSDQVEIKLPPINLGVHQHAVLMVPNDDDYAFNLLTSQVGFLDFDLNEIPLSLLSSYGGEVALIKSDSAEMVDYLIYGSKSSLIDPDPSQWSGANAPKIKNEQKMISLIRKTPYKDTDTKDDWAASEFITIGGSNEHALCKNDTDLDDIPDCAEDGLDESGLADTCEYFNDMPLYQMGARINVQDFFAEIDIQDSDDLVIHQASLLRAQQVFTDYHGALPKKLHLDMGVEYTDSFDPLKQNLHTGLHHPGGQALPNTEYLDVQKKSDLTQLTAADSHTNVFDQKILHQDIRRFYLFRYAVLGHTNPKDKGNTICAATLGRAPLFGAVMSLHMSHFLQCKGEILNFNETQQRNFYINKIAATFIHELGHNLGLRHGGDEDVNLKPNYVSTMNYLYESLDVQNQSDGQSYYYKNSQCKFLYNISYDTMSHSMTGPTSDIKLDYSYGNNHDIDESNIDETIGLGWSSGSVLGVDYNCNGLATDKNFSLSLSDVSSTVVISDFNDWEVVENRSRSSQYLNIKHEPSALNIDNAIQIKHLSNCPQHGIN